MEETQYNIRAPQKKKGKKINALLSIIHHKEIEYSNADAVCGQEILRQISIYCVNFHGSSCILSHYSNPHFAPQSQYSNHQAFSTQGQ